MSNIRYTTEQENNIVALYNAGTPIVEIIRETGACRSVIYRMVNKSGVVMRYRSGKYVRKPQHPTKFEQNKSAIVALYAAGFNREKIGKSLSVSQKIIEKSIREFRAANPEFDTPKVLARLERDKKICELRRAGKTYREIGEIVRMSEPGVCGVCSKYGITASAKRARKDNGEIPQEILAPLVEYMRKFISAEFADKVQELAKNMAA